MQQLKEEPQVVNILYLGCAKRENKNVWYHKMDGIIKFLLIVVIIALIIIVVALLFFGVPPNDRGLITCYIVGGVCLLLAFIRALALPSKPVTKNVLGAPIYNRRKVLSYRPNQVSAVNRGYAV